MVIFDKSRLTLHKLFLISLPFLLNLKKMAIDNPAPSLESVILNTLTEWLPVLTGIVVGLLFGLIWYSVKTKPTGPSPYPPVINRGHFLVDYPSPTPPVTNRGHFSVDSPSLTLPVTNHGHPLPLGGH